MRRFDGHKFHNLRKSRGYSLKVLSRMLEARAGVRVSKSAISHWELGLCKPSLNSLLALGELFEVPLDYFFEPQTNYLLEAMASASLLSRSAKKAGKATDVSSPVRQPEQDGPNSGHKGG